MSKLDHVLIVDDDPEIRQLLAEYLRDAGYQTSTACDGKEMHRRLEMNVIDLIVLDRKDWPRWGDDDPKAWGFLGMRVACVHDVLKAQVYKRVFDFLDLNHVFVVALAQVLVDVEYDQR